MRLLTVGTAIRGGEKGGNGGCGGGEGTMISCAVEACCVRLAKKGVCGGIGQGGMGA